MGQPKKWPYPTVWRNFSGRPWKVLHEFSTVPRTFQQITQSNRVKNHKKGHPNAPSNPSPYKTASYATLSSKRCKLHSSWGYLQDPSVHIKYPHPRGLWGNMGRVKSGVHCYPSGVCYNFFDHRQLIFKYNLMCITCEPLFASSPLQSYHFNLGHNKMKGNLGPLFQMVLGLQLNFIELLDFITLSI